MLLAGDRAIIFTEAVTRAPRSSGRCDTRLRGYAARRGAAARRRCRRRAQPRRARWSSTSASRCSSRRVALGYGEPVWPFVAAGAITRGLGWGARAAHDGRERDRRPRGVPRRLARRGSSPPASARCPYIFGEPQLPARSTRTSSRCPASRRPARASLTDIPALNRAMLMWRQFTQWLGGMGIIVLALAVLPRLRVGGRQLVESEMPGPGVRAARRVDPRHRAAALAALRRPRRRCSILVLCDLRLGGARRADDLYDAAAHAFTTLPTGGFSPQARSVEPFAAATQWVMVVFMVLAGANFALCTAGSYAAAALALVRDEEFRLYVVPARRVDRDPAPRAAREPRSTAARRPSGTPSSRSSRS